MRWIAYMPLRGGSKSIPGKNHRSLLGKPLFAWSLQAAVESGCFDEIWVGTDDESIRLACKSRFAGQVQLFERSAETCTDEATSESALLEFSEKVSFDVICLVQATSPLTSASDFRAAQKLFLEEKADSLLTATRTKRFFWSPSGRPLNYEPTSRPRRQSFAGSFMENGAFYLTRHGILETTGCRLGGSISIYEMPEEHAVEIDEPADWPLVESMLRQRRSAPGSDQISRIRALVVDVDGTMTDGGMYYGADGEALKKFNTRDALGLKRVQQAGIELCVMTQENSEAVHARMRKLNINNYYHGVRDKLACLHAVADEWQLPLELIAYIGDDLNDLPCINAVGFACCPRDAAPEIRSRADYVTSERAGMGAVREVCNLLLSNRGESEDRS